jgi:hypothetical protein
MTLDDAFFSQEEGYKLIGKYLYFPKEKGLESMKKFP